MGFGRPGGSRRCRAASKEVSGGQGKPRAPERWPQTSGRGLDDDFQVEAFSVKSLFGCPGGFRRCQAASKEISGVQEIPEPEDGCLRDLEQVWMMTLFRSRNCSVKSGRLLCLLGRVQEEEEGEEEE